MSVLNRILLAPNHRILAFCGMKSRHSLLKKCFTELAGNQQKVLIASLGTRKLPVSGAVVFGRDIPILCEQIDKEFETHSVVYIGKEFQGSQMNGFGLAELEQVKARLTADYFLIDLANGSERVVYDVKTVRQWTRAALWQQLIYCLEISQIEQPFNKNGIDRSEYLQAIFPGESVLSQNLLLAYLTDEWQGSGALFKQTWQTLLFFSDIGLMKQENRAISLSRELKAREVKYVGIGDIYSSKFTESIKLL